MAAKNTVILTVNNKEGTIERILNGLCGTLSSDTNHIIIILDGCTDGSRAKVYSFIADASSRFSFDVISTDDVWETKANNVGLKMVITPYATIVQDDMLLKEKSWDRKLLDIFDSLSVFAVSGRTAHDFSLDNGQFTPLNLAGREYPMGSVGILPRLVGKVIALFQPFWIYRFVAPTAIRLTVNRGPLVINMSMARELNFFDEEFAPFELDDVDLCCRAYKRFGLCSVARPVYFTEISGSKASNISSSLVSNYSIRKNTQILIKRHSDLAGSR